MLKKIISRKKVEKRTPTTPPVRSMNIFCGEKIRVTYGPNKGKIGTCHSFALMGDINVEMDDVSLGILNFSINAVEKIGDNND